MIGGLAYKWLPFKLQHLLLLTQRGRASVNTGIVNITPPPQVGEALSPFVPSVQLQLHDRSASQSTQSYRQLYQRVT
ncbi:hypothetical protein HOY82DRAFT_152072 [Tuber indicum]|nr:hypothetical protein HOY82DRAFT_152072 [Tuber indicum]